MPRGSVVSFEQEPASMTEAKLLGRIRLDPKVLTGKPVIAGTRIAMDFILKLLAQGMPQADILREHPRLKAADIQASLLYAEKILGSETVLPLPAAPRR